MKRFGAAACAAALLLVGCGLAGAENLHEHVHRSLPANGVSSVHVEGISGDIIVRAGKTNAVIVDAIKNASSEDELARTHVDVSVNGNDVMIRSAYDSHNGWLNFGHGGGSVDYTVTVPARVNVNATSVSGDVSVSGIAGDVFVRDVSGDVNAKLGRLANGRAVDLTAISGTVHATIARDSAVRISAKTISGDINEFRGADTGARGAGAASMNLSTVSGDIIVSPQ